jgi:outer membrane protein assembly factor BamB
MINDTLEAIRKAQEAGETPEGAETISYKEAAARYKFRQAVKRVASLLFAGAALIAATMALTQAYTPPPRLADDYQEAMKAAAEAVRKHSYENAAKIWQEFYVKIPNKQSETAQLVMKHLSNLPTQTNAFVETSLKPIEAQEKAGHLDAAEAGYKRLLEQYGQSAFVDRMQAGLERIAAKRRDLLEERRAADLRGQLEKAQSLLQRKQYTAARAALEQLLDRAPADSAERTDAENGLKQIKDLEARVQAAVEAAAAEVRDNKGEKAIESFEKAATEWPDLPAAEAARRQSRDLKARLDIAKQELRSAEGTAAQGAVLDAIENLRRIQREYPEFELQSTVKERLNLLIANADAIVARITRAQETYKRDKVQGRRLFAALVKEQAVFLAARKVEVPVFITSHPIGAAVAIDDRPAGVAPLDVSVPIGKPFILRLEKQGYVPWKDKILRLTPEDQLEIHVALNREALRILEFKPSIVAPPVVIGQQLYVLHGTSLSVQDPLGTQLAWSLAGLLDDTVSTRPNSDGSGTPQFVNDRTWWYPRTPPETSGPGTLILPLPSREVLEIDEASHTFKKLVTLPVEPVGRVHLERVSLLAGKALIAVGCADGRIRTYELAKPGVPLWEKPADPATPAPKGTLATGLASRPNGTFLALSASGRLTCFNAVNGQESWSMTVKGPLAPADCLPASTSVNLAALVRADDGCVTLVDLNQHDVVWELPKAQALDEASHAAVSNDGVYVVTREGVLRKYPPDRTPVKPAPLWRKSLDNGTDVPLVVGKSIYVVSTFGTLYALSPDDGHELWKQKIEGTATQLVEHGNVLYVSTKEGRLILLSTE